MKNVFNYKTNLNVLENLVRTMSKGYYSNFNEYNPNHTEMDEFNDHSMVEENNDHSYPNGFGADIEAK